MRPERLARAIWDQRHGPATFLVSSVEPTTTSRGRRVYVNGVVLALGAKRGTWRRTFLSDDNGGISVAHDALYLQSQARGIACGRAWVRESIRRYRASDRITSVTVEACGESGGWAWAHSGFDWRDGAYTDVPQRLEQYVCMPQKKRREWTLEIGSYTPVNRDVEDRLVEALESFGTDRPVTPAQLAMIGKPIFHDKDAVWPGKRILLGSSWGGVIKT